MESVQVPLVSSGIHEVVETARRVMRLPMVAAELMASPAALVRTKMVVPSAGLTSTSCATVRNTVNSIPTTGAGRVNTTAPEAPVFVIVAPYKLLASSVAVAACAETLFIVTVPLAFGNVIVLSAVGSVMANAVSNAFLVAPSNVKPPVDVPLNTKSPVRSISPAETMESG